MEVLESWGSASSHLSNYQLTFVIFLKVFNMMQLQAGTKTERQLKRGKNESAWRTTFTRWGHRDFIQFDLNLKKQLDKDKNMMAIE